MRRLAAIVSSLSLVVLSTTGVANAQARRSDEFIVEVERSMPGLLDRYEVPAVAVGLIEGNDVVWTGAFGEAEPDDVFEVASLTKTAVSLAVLSLADRGLLDIDAPIDRYLTRWHVPRGRYDESLVTARTVLGNIAGFPLGGTLRRIEEGYPRIESILDGNHGIPAAVVRSEPGRKFTYSNPGYGVIELLIEELRGKPFPRAMRELVFDPLGMNDTGFQDDDALARRHVPGFHRSGQPAPRRLAMPRAAGGMVTTADDAARLLIGATLPKQAGGLLEVETLKQMRSLSKASIGAFGLRDGGYALGIAQAWLPSGRTFIANNGSFDGTNAMMAAVPEQRTGFVVLTNSSTGLGIELEVLLTWLRTVIKEQPEAVRRLATSRDGLRLGTIVAIVLGAGWLVFTGSRVAHERRRWQGLRVRPLLLKTVPLLALSAGLGAVFDTNLLTKPIGGIPPARFVSGDYQWLIAGLAIALAAIGLAATVVPKVRATRD